MPTSLKQIYKGGEFVPTFFSTPQVVSSGATGTILTLTAPANKKVRLISLAFQGITNEPTITIVIDGVTVINSKILSSSPSLNNFIIAQSLIGTENSGTIFPAASVLPYVEADSTITVSTLAATTNGIVYSYCYGE